jgi:hypothetical protein
MAPALPVGVVRVLEEVLAEEVGVVAGWEVTDLDLVPVVIVSAPIAELEYPIR